MRTIVKLNKIHGIVRSFILSATLLMGLNFNSLSQSADFSTDINSWTSWENDLGKWLEVSFGITNNGPNTVWSYLNTYIYLSTDKTASSESLVGTYSAGFYQYFESSTRWTIVKTIEYSNLTAGDYYIGVFKTTEDLDPNPDNNLTWSTDVFSINITGIEDIRTKSSTWLEQNYPNPFSTSTKIKFYLSKPGKVELAIFNPVGVKISSLLNKNFESGLHLLDWVPPDFLKSGIYYYQLKGDGVFITRKMLYNK